MKNIFKFIGITGIAGLAVFLLFMFFAPGFAQTGEAIILTAVFAGIWIAFDKYVMKELDTLAEIKKGNIAYALLLVAVTLVFIAVAILVG